MKNVKNIYITIAGLVGTLAIVDGISSTIDFLTFKTSLISTSILLISYFGLFFYLKKRSIRLDKNTNYKVSAFSPNVKFYMLGILLAIWMPIIIKHYESEEELICDRNIDDGCSLNIKYVKGSTYELNYSGAGIAAPTQSQQYAMMRLFFNDSLYQVFIPKDENVNPDLPNFDIRNTPLDYYSKFIKVLVKNGRVQFEGEIFDLKDDKLIGWFNGNEFGTNGCGISWNKDDTAVEILDHYGNVCFSAEYYSVKTKDGTPVGVITLFGYFKHEGVFHIFDQYYTKTTNEKIAEQLIKRIPPIFNHRGRKSTGKRIGKRLVPS